MNESSVQPLVVQSFETKCRARKVTKAELQNALMEVVKASAEQIPPPTDFEFVMFSLCSCNSVGLSEV